MRQLLPYAQLVRLPNTFTAMADIFLGALATGLLLERPGKFICLLLASTLLYWSGMIWNDYFDLDQDRKERPGRPIASGRVSLQSAACLGIAFMAIGVVLAGLADWLSADKLADIRFRSLPIAIALVISIFLYDGVLKATFAGPIFMGLCRSLNILLGLSILGAWPPFWGWLIAIIIGIYIGGVTWFARTEARTSSQPMLIGAAIAMLVSLLLALTVPALALEPPCDGQPSLLFPYLLALFGGYLGIAVIAAIRRPDPGRVQPVIKRAVMGLVVLDALLASAFVGSFGLLLIVLLIPGLFLGRWLYST
jgi:4-hydroxybenzoate polyprenyltransferase